jgi:hypothetical protein
LKNTPQACPVWIYTQSNITSIISATVENITICCGLSGLKRSENQILALRLVSEKNRREKVRSVPTVLLFARTNSPGGKWAEEHNAGA